MVLPGVFFISRDQIGVLKSKSRIVVLWMWWDMRA